MNSTTFTSKRGLSILEVTVVILISTILASIAIPTYKKYIKRGIHIEAKNNLAFIYQSQHTYYAETNRFHHDLKKIDAVPRGIIRYNIAADWDVSGSPISYSLSGSSSSPPDPLHCPCCGSGAPGVNNCCIDPNPYAPNDPSYCSAPKPCYGGELSSTVKDLLANSILAGSTLIDPYKKSIYNKSFKYFAFGCTSSSRRDLNQLDLWSIDNHKFLSHDKNR